MERDEQAHVLRKLRSFIACIKMLEMLWESKYQSVEVSASCFLQCSGEATLEQDMQIFDKLAQKGWLGPGLLSGWF